MCTETGEENQARWEPTSSLQWLNRSVTVYITGILEWIETDLSKMQTKHSHLCLTKYVFLHEHVRGEINVVK